MDAQLKDLLKNLLILFQNGEYDKLRDGALKITELNPELPQGWMALGVALQKLECYSEALPALIKTVELSPLEAQNHANLACTLLSLGQCSEAEASCRQALKLNPSSAEINNNLGSILKELNRFDEAEIYYEKAIKINPSFAEAYCNIGDLLIQKNNFSEAEKSIRKALDINYDYPLAHNNLGVALRSQGKFPQANVSFKNAISLKKNYALAHLNLGQSFYSQNLIGDALSSFYASLLIEEMPMTKYMFVTCLKNCSINQYDKKLAGLVCKAISETWGRPSSIANFSIQLIKLDINHINIIKYYCNISKEKCEFKLIIDYVKSDSIELFKATLCAGLIPDIEIEKFLIWIRRELLYQAYDIDRHDGMLSFCSALAQQCFINDYCYFETDEELKLVGILKKNLIEYIKKQEQVSPIQLAIAGCYFPLSNLFPTNDGIKNINESCEYFKKLINLQVNEPQAEIEVKKAIPKLTEIEEETSVLVQNQYEHHPYPRWVRMPKNYMRQFITKKFNDRVTVNEFYDFENIDELEVLIAGCGTGQHPIEVAQMLESKKANIIAVDLSLASLAYAIRKSIEMEFSNIYFAQADIMKLGVLDKKFDLIESSGVLHHLNDPAEGWRTLLSLLKPSGRMKVGLYSKVARKDINKVRSLISKNEIGFDPKELKKFRQDLIYLNKTDPLGFAISSADFYSTVGCRDLLFHVQEHQFDLDLIASFIQENQLNFLGFVLDSFVLTDYKQKFPNDPLGINLQQWKIYEEKNPYTFVQMYQFWISKK